VATPALDTSVELHVTGMVVRGVVRQAFVNPAATWAEAVYVGRRSPPDARRRAEHRRRHRDTHFRFLRGVKAGDEILVAAPARAPVRFRVRDTAIVDSRTAVLAGAGEARGIVLVTCYPFDALRPGGPLRYLVLADADDR
jgi:hypothetical protein